jgi:hypothetical protein
VIEVTPEVPLVQTESYMLTVDSQGAGALGLLRDFSGNPVLADPSQEWGISVKEMAGDRGRSELREEFDSSLLRSGVALPGYDGTAAWRESGRVAIRFPSAAGSGGDGQVVLSEREERADVQGVSLDLPEGGSCRLRATPGLVVLRCQGRMSIRGQLTRDVPWDPARELERDPTLAAWSKWSRARRNPFEDVPVPTPWVLSEWLAATRAGDLNWTVLIAGGDLSIEGEFKCSNPVLLVAGGAIRVSGSVRGVEAPELGLGGVFLPPDTGAGGEVWPEMKASLVVDEPTGRNPLVEPLRFAVISSPVPPSGDVLRWLPARIGGSPRDERWRVRFVPEFASAPRRPEDLAAVDEPDLIATPGPIRFLIELEVPPDDV